MKGKNGLDQDYQPFFCTDQGPNEGGQEGNNSPRAESLRGAEKSSKYHKYFLQFSIFASERSQVRTWVRQTYFLSRAPSNLVTSLAQTTATF